METRHQLKLSLSMRSFFPPKIVVASVGLHVPVQEFFMYMDALVQLEGEDAFVKAIIGLRASENVTLTDRVYDQVRSCRRALRALCTRSLLCLHPCHLAMC